MRDLFDNRRATAVLLADGWHEIEDGTLEGVNYEFSMTQDSVPHAGIRWRELDEAGVRFAMFAPLGQVLAISGGWPEHDEEHEATPRSEAVHA